MKAILVFFLCVLIQVLANGQTPLVAYTDPSQLVTIAKNAGQFRFWQIAQRYLEYNIDFYSLMGWGQAPRLIVQGIHPRGPASDLDSRQFANIFEV